MENSSTNTNNIMSYTNILGYVTKTSMLLPEHYDQWDDRMEEYLNGLDESHWSSLTDGPNDPSKVTVVSVTGSSKSLANTKLTMKQHDER